MFKDLLRNIGSFFEYYEMIISIGRDQIQLSPKYVNIKVYLQRKAG